MEFIKRMRTSKGFLRAVSCLTAVLFIGTFTGGAALKDDNVLSQVRGYLKAYYVDDLPASTLNLPTVNDIIKEINKTDPHTMYFTADKYASFTDSINNTFSGIGVQIEMVPLGVQILSVFDGSPAEGAKLQPGDIIMIAGSHVLAGLPDDVAVGYIKGPEGTSIRLKIKRGDSYYSVRIVRKKINAPTVTGKVLDNHIGYIDISSFGEDTGNKFGEILKADEDKKVDGYIVDLRNNGGGYLTTALDIAGYFVGNKLALITRGRIDGETKQNGVQHYFTVDKKPVIFLINEYSASASEILSGALRDYDKAYFLGVKSYGKGSVQMPVTLSNKDVLKMTIDKFFSPNGTTIDKVGITPNMVVPDTIDSMKVAELILDSPAKMTDTTGYFKITANGKTAIAKLSKVDTQDYWNSYKQLLSLAATGGTVQFGNGSSWVTPSAITMSDAATMYYPDYKVEKKETGVTTESAITINFNTTINKDSINSKNIELIDSASGSRSTLDIKSIADDSAVIAPKEKFKNNKMYYLVVNPGVQKSDKTNLGNGFIYELETTK